MTEEPRTEFIPKREGQWEGGKVKALVLEVKSE
jgi:hypothetical protein